MCRVNLGRLFNVVALVYNQTCLQLGQWWLPFRSMSNYWYVYPTSAKGPYLPAFIDTQDPQPYQHQHPHCATRLLALAPDGIHQQEAFASWQALGSDQLSHLCQYSMSFSFRTHSCHGPDKSGPVLYPNWVRYHHPGMCGMLQLFFQNIYDFLISCQPKSHNSIFQKSHVVHNLLGE